MIANKSPFNPYGYNVVNVYLADELDDIPSHGFRLHPGEALKFKGYSGGLTNTKVGTTNNSIFPPNYIKVMTTQAYGPLTIQSKIYVVGTSYNAEVPQ